MTKAGLFHPGRPVRLDPGGVHPRRQRCRGNHPPAPPLGGGQFPGQTRKESHQRLAGKVLWEPGVRLPDIVDAADLRVVGTGKPVTRIRRLRVAQAPPHGQLPPLRTDLGAIGRLAMQARQSEKRRRPHRKRKGERGAPAAGGGNIRWAPLDRIQTNRAHQPREGLIEENVRRIVATFEHDPKEFWELFSPPEVRPIEGGRYELIHGHHRFEAAKRIQARQPGAFPRGIPVKVLHVTPERARQIADAANLSNAPMRPTEIAPLLARWLDAGSTPDQIMQAMPGLAQNGVKKGDIPAYARVASLPKALLDGLDNPALRNRYTLSHALEFARAQEQFHFQPAELQALYTRLFITDPKEVTPMSLRQTLQFLGSKMKEFRKEQPQGADRFSDADFGGGNVGMMDALSQLTATQAALDTEQRQLARLRGSLERSDIPSLRDPALRRKLIAEAEERIADLKARAAQIKKDLWGGIQEGRRAANPAGQQQVVARFVRSAVDAAADVYPGRDFREWAKQYRRGGGGPTTLAWEKAHDAILRSGERTPAAKAAFYALTAVWALHGGRFDQADAHAEEALRGAVDAKGTQGRLLNPRRSRVRDDTPANVSVNDLRVKGPVEFTANYSTPLFSPGDRLRLEAENPSRDVAARPLRYEFRVGDIVEIPAELDGGRAGLGLMAQVIADRDEMAFLPDAVLLVRVQKTGHVVRVAKDEAAPIRPVRPIYGDQLRLLNPRRPAGRQVGFDAAGALFETPYYEQSAFEPPRATGKQATLDFGLADLGLTARELTPEEEVLVNKGKLRAEIAQARLFNNPALPRSPFAGLKGQVLAARINEAIEAALEVYQQPYFVDWANAYRATKRLTSRDAIAAGHVVQHAYDDRTRAWNTNDLFRYYGAEAALEAATAVHYAALGNKYSSEQAAERAVRAAVKAQRTPQGDQLRLLNPPRARTERVPCPDCGHELTVRPHATRLRCPQCDALVGVVR